MRTVVALAAAAARHHGMHSPLMLDKAGSLAPWTGYGGGGWIHKRRQQQQGGTTTVAIWLVVERLGDNTPRPTATASRRRRVRIGP